MCLTLSNLITINCEKMSNFIPLCSVPHMQIAAGMEVNCAVKKREIVMFDSSTTWDRSTTHPKFNPTRVRTHDL